MTTQALQSALVALDAKFGPARRREFLVHHKARRRGIVNGYMRSDSYWPLLNWLSEIAPRQFLSTDEATAWLRKEYRRRRKLAACEHWSAKSYPKAAERAAANRSVSREVSVGMSSFYSRRPDPRHRSVHAAHRL